MSLWGLFRRARRRTIASAVALSMAGAVLTVPVTLAVLEEPAAAATPDIEFKGAWGYASESFKVTSIPIVKPVPTSPGDVMIAQVSAWADAVITPPAGWVLIRSDTNGASGEFIEQHLYYRVAGPADPPEFRWNSAVATHMAANITSWSNVNTSAPIAAHSGSAGPIGYVGYDWEDAPSVTATTVNAMNLLFFAGRTYTADHDPITTPSGYSQRYTAGVVYVDQAVHSRLLTSTGPTGAQSVNGTASTSAGQQVILRAVNSRPAQAAINAPAPGGMFRAGEAQSFTATATDPDNDAWSAAFTVFDANGNFVQSFSGSTTASGLPSTGSPVPPLPGGSYRVSAHAVDVNGNTGPESGQVSFAVQSDAGTLSAEPLAQTRVTGEQAFVTFTARNANGNPLPFSAITISRSGSNPAPPQTFFTNSAGVYTYGYTGNQAGGDVVQAVNGAGGAPAFAGVTWAPSSGASGYPSDACSTSENVVSGHIGGTYLHVRHDIDPSDHNVRRVCVAAQDGGTHIGGQLRFGAPTAIDVGVDTTEAAANACLAIGQRIDGGQFAGGQEYFLDVAPNPNGSLGAWTCVRVGPVFVRIRTAAAVPVTLEFLPDSSAPKAYAEHPMTGTWSRACKDNGGTRFVNVRVGSEQAALYTWASGSKTQVCVRANGAGGRVDVDSAAVPAISTGDNRDASTPWPLFDNGELGIWTVDPLAPSVPAGVYLRVLGFGQRVTVGGASGTPVAVLLD